MMCFHSVNFGLPRTFCSRVRSRHATDGRTDSDGQILGKGKGKGKGKGGEGKGREEEEGMGKGRRERDRMGGE